jgi:hypothetical protein
MEFRIKIHPEQRLTRIPKILTENFGTVWTLIPNSEAAIIFREMTKPELVLKSLAILQQTLQLRTENKKRPEH